MDLTPIPNTDSNQTQQPNTQPANQQLTITQVSPQLVAPIPIDVSEANVRQSGQIVSSQNAERQCPQNDHPNKPNAQIIDLDDEESRKCEEPKEVCLNNEKCINQKPCQQVCQQSKPFEVNVPHEEQNQSLPPKTTNQNPILDNQKDQQIIEMRKQNQTNNPIIQQQIIIEQSQIPIQIQTTKEITSKQHQPNLSNNDTIHQSFPIQQNQPEAQQITNNLNLPQLNQSHSKTQNCPSNTLIQPMIDENKDHEKNNDQHIQLENNFTPQNPSSTNLKNSPSSQIHESGIIQESKPQNTNQAKKSDLSGSIPILIEDCQSIQEVPQKEIHQKGHGEKNQNDKIAAQENILNVPDPIKNFNVQLVSEPQNFDKINQKVQSESVEKSESQKPKQGNQSSLDNEKFIEGNGKKDVKKIKQLLLSSLSGDMAETLTLLSDDEILRIFEQIQADEGKKEDEKKQTDENLKVKQSKSSPQQSNNTTQNPKKSKGKEEVKETSKPNTRQIKSSPKAQRQQFELSNNQKSMQSNKEVRNGSKFLSKNIEESDKFQECKEGTPQTFQKKIPQKKSGSKKKIVTTIIQQVEYFEDEERQEQTLSKYRKNENGESKRVNKKQKMNTILSQISNLVHELNFQQLQEQQKQ